MKKYRLKKEYPNSPKVGTILEYYCGLYLQKDTGNMSMRKEQVENYPEYWEEVIDTPLFTTEDGVDIFEGDKYYSVWREDLTLQGTFKAEKVNFGKFTNPKSMIVFSTKETAEEYILMNKPCLSINDVSESWGFTKNEERKFVNGSLTIDNLIKLVKSRM